MNGCKLLTGRPQVIQFPRSPTGRSKHAPSSSAVGTKNGVPPKPSWHALYAMAAAVSLILVVAVAAAPTAEWRIMAEYLGSGLVLGVIALWLRANRSALALAEVASGGEETFHSYTICSAELSFQQSFESDEAEDGSQTPRMPMGQEDPNRALLH